VICLDTNFLIRGMMAGTGEAGRLFAWLAAGERFCAPTIVWYEFECGPNTPAQLAAARALLKEVLPFEVAQAQEAAHLYAATGRRRRLRFDAMIAASAIVRGVPLATANQADFAPFVTHGLNLLP
jgi:predicted nucleic acid-binding protein